MSLTLQNLAFSYPGSSFGFELSELEIAPGQCLALVGPSGSGKSTLLNLIAGVTAPQRGRIVLGDTVLSELTPSQRNLHRLNRIGMIFQSFELLDYLDVGDNILLQARLSKQVRLDDEIRQRAQQVAGDLGLADKWQRNVQALSQGERQRVAVCRALLLDPSLVLADEPTGNLDPDNKQAVLQRLIEDCKSAQRILLTVTHDHSLLPHFDRVIEIQDLIQTVDEVNG